MNALLSLNPRREHGVVLVVSLLMLLVLTLIGLAATRSTTIEQRMTANQHSTTVAVQGAEAALRNGEDALNSAGLPNFALNTAGAYTEAGMPDWKTMDWDNAGLSTAYSGGLDPSKTGSTVTTPAALPRYYLVLTGYSIPVAGSSLSADAPLVSKIVYYVYAHSYGLNTDSAVVLRSTYAR